MSCCVFSFSCYFLLPLRFNIILLFASTVQASTMDPLPAEHDLSMQRSVSPSAASTSLDPTVPTLILPVLSKGVAGNKVWSIPSFRLRMFSYLQNKDLAKAMLVKKDGMPEAIKVLYYKVAIDAIENIGKEGPEKVSHLPTISYDLRSFGLILILVKIDAISSSCQRD